MNAPLFILLFNASEALEKAPYRGRGPGVLAELQRVLLRAEIDLQHACLDLRYSGEPEESLKPSLAALGAAIDALRCPGFEIGAGQYSGCNALATYAKDCPVCGPRVTCTGCGGSVLEIEAKGWRCLTMHDTEAGMVCPTCQDDGTGREGPNP